MTNPNPDLFHNLIIRHEPLDHSESDAGDASKLAALSSHPIILSNRV
jgi:hypothetical protein